jgi:hypothetical protein
LKDPGTGRARDDRPSSRLEGNSKSRPNGSSWSSDLGAVALDNVLHDLALGVFGTSPGQHIVVVVPGHLKVAGGRGAGLVDEHRRLVNVVTEIGFSDVRAVHSIDIAKYRVADPGVFSQIYTAVFGVNVRNNSKIGGYLNRRLAATDVTGHGFVHTPEPFGTVSSLYRAVVYGK